MNSLLQFNPISVSDTTQNTAVHEACGTHLLLTLSRCANSNLFNDEQALRTLAEQAARATGAIVLETMSHAFHPQGVTVVLVLAESHASLHTYPESGAVFWDCFTCGRTCNPEFSVALLVEALRPSTVQQQLITRNADSPATN